MAGGWSEDGAVQKQIDATVDDAIARARSHLRHGESAEFCEECGEPIPERRRLAIAGVKLCIDCQTAHDRKWKPTGGIHRRGSKDSQLK